MADRKIRTMEEFATASGFSRPTVSKYFNDPASVREGTRSRIEQALKEHDYRPSLFAVNLNRRKPRVVGVVVPYTTDPFYAEVTRHVELRCIQSGFLAVVLNSHGDPRLEARAIQTLRSLRIAGAIVAPLGFGSDAGLMHRLLQDIPVVFLDSRLDDEAPFVGTDNDQSIGLMVDYLSRTGAPPAFFEMPEVNRNALERRDAYLRAMERLGLAPELISPADRHTWNFEEVGYAGALRMIDGSGFPTRTVLCANDRLAFGVMSAACERRVKVGRGSSDLRVAGHDDHPLSRYACPSLTTVAQDYDRLGHLCVDVLLAKIGDGTAAGEGGEPPDRILLAAKLVMRASA